MKNQKFLVLLLTVIMVFATSSTVFAKANNKPVPFTGKATHTDSDEWTKKGKAQKYEDISVAQKVVTTKQGYVGNFWYPKNDSGKVKWYATTDNYKHKKNKNDTPTVVKSTSTTYTFSGSTNGTIKSWGVKVGCSASKTSSTSISQPLDSSASTGYYYYGCTAKYIDLKHNTKTVYYKKVKGMWQKTKTTNSTPTGALLAANDENTGVYYDWRKQSN